MSNEIISREDALAQGLTHFFTGIVCSKGHLDLRFVSTKQCTECVRLWKKEWRLLNRDKMNQAERLRRKRNPEKTTKNYKRWQTTAHGRAIKARLQRERRARLRGSKGRHTQHDIAEILKSQRSCCAYCRLTLQHGYEVDHITALAQGGSNERRNIQLLCASCNRHKRTKDPIRFAQEMGYLI
jgi:5-methylcytosine-specific restriction endonuclease McrA